ncbi:hypothetical protein [Tautonia sociabilis]|uniref:Uncharacterized protein n=1 Tax=Tautonia sociabilis TaxID=2080755 RepID=A0A432MLG3_9BACT|nr:hypothetical protein [Tautonia sociabilis]RUL88242.1 hypothetical protein TsocGM_07850 [Tautonia sociabilis]
MNQSKMFTLLLLAGGLGLLTVFWTGQPYSRRLSDTELAAVSGRDPNSKAVTFDCAPSSLDEGQVAWSNCDGQAPDTPCVSCEHFIATGEPGVGTNVQFAGANARCTPFRKYVGKCDNGECTDRMLTPDRCDGRAPQYFPQ